MKPQKNILEWVVFAISAVLLAGVAATLIIAGTRGGNGKPSLLVETGAPEAHGRTFRIPIRVRNVGDATAEQAHIDVELLDDGNVVEHAELTIMFVPKQSIREGWVAFRNDPRCCTLHARAAFNAP